MSSPELRSLPLPGLGPGICILGMHRSGTSLVAGLLRICGVDLGPDARMMEPKPDNPSGFWEHRDVHTLNEQLLARLGGSWDRPGDLAAGWQDDADLEPFYRRAQEVVERDFAARAQWALKDPRTCLLLPFWQNVVPELRYVICVRNPLDAARSLRRRNRLSTLESTRLWTLYTAAALHHTREAERIITHTDRYLEPGSDELERLGRFLGLANGSVKAARHEIEAFVDLGKWHHHTRPEITLRSDDLDADARLLYSALLGADGQARRSRDRARDERRLDPDSQLAAVVEQVWRHELERQERRRLQAQLCSRQAELDDSRSRQAESQAALEEARERLFEVRTRTANLEQWVEERQQDVKRQQLEIAKLEAVVAEQRDRLEAVTSSLGWQMLDRFRRLKQRLLARGRSIDLFYRRLADGWRRQLAGSGGAKRVVPASPFEAADLSAFEAPPELEVVEVEPPAAWRLEAGLPAVVIVIPNWNRLHYLRQCLDSIFAETVYPRYRVCVVDQGSSDGSREYLESLGEQLEVIAADTNLGFVHANNLALRKFRRWDVVFLNNDTRVTRGWLERLVETAYAAPTIGLVGAKLIYPDGRLQEAGSQLFRDGNARAYGKFENQGDPRFNQRRVVDYCSASCLLVKREVLDRCGSGFDECYSPCYYEDADLALQAAKAGYKTLYEPTSTVIHQEYGTSGRTLAHRFMARNRQRFVTRWRDELATRPASLWQAPQTGRDQVLVIGDIVPAPDRSAGGSRLYHLLRLLAERYDTSYAFLKDQMIEEYLLPLERVGVTVFYPGMAKAVGDNDLNVDAILTDNRFHAVILSLHTIAARYLGLVRKQSPQSRVIVDSYDVHFLREERQAQLSNDDELLARARSTREAELTSYQRADAVITVTEEDREALLRESPELEIGIVPTLHEPAARLVAREARRDLLFVGGFSHLPNGDAVTYFCREVLPRVRSQIADVRLHVVGNSPLPEILALDGEGVRVHGYVPNLRPFLESCLVSVAPIRFGSGMKGKIADAMACGLPVVTTSIGAEGMALVDGEEALIADDAEGFAERIVALHRDDELWRRISRGGHQRVRRDWTPAAAAEPLFALLDRAREPAS